MVCDLRGQSEVAAAPDCLPVKPGLTTLHLPIEANGINLEIMAPVLRGDAAGIEEAMSKGYIAMVDDHAADVFGLLLATRRP